MRNITTLYFERKETKFVGNKTAIFRRNRSSLYLLFVKLALLLCLFFVYPTYDIRKSKPGATVISVSIPSDTSRALKLSRKSGIWN